jgi:nucleoside diphosphate kinase
MSEELAYVLITPYTVAKSRTGGVIARLLSRTRLEFIGARMLAPTKEFIKKYVDNIEESASADSRHISELLSSYVKENFAPHGGKYKRIMLLLFRGKNARQKIYDIVGGLNSGIRTGETIRDTYSDYVLNNDGSVRYFEPAVIVSPLHEKWKKTINIFADLICSQPNIIDKPLFSGENNEKRTLVIIKPDNWRYPSARPGNIIDMLSKTGLRIVGCKLYRMSVEEALDFYGPVKNALREKLAPRIGKQSRDILESALKIPLEDSVCNILTESVGYEFADDQFSKLVEFMSGIRPEECPSDNFSAPGIVKCLILIYQGEDAVEKIRDVLGPTDPTKAPGGTIRRDFGTDIMVNTAHASDSYESADREMKIVKIEENNIYQIIKNHYNLD